MKTIYTLLFCFAFLFSCAKKEIKKEDLTNKKNVKKVTNIWDRVKIYNDNPSYFLNIQRDNNLTCEVLVNDYPILIDYNPRIIKKSISINEAILKSGKQKLTIRMTPPVDQDYYMGYEIDMQKIALKISISYGVTGKDPRDQFKEVLRYELPQQKGRLPYYEVNLEFDAFVPYQNEIEGWQNSVDLSKEDKNKLLKEVEDFYKKIIQQYKNQDINALAFKYYKSRFEVAQMNYQTSTYYSNMIVNEWIENVNDDRPFIFDQYMIRFYGNGKMVALVKTDRYYINLSALLREDPVTSQATWYDMYLHRPKTNAPLEIIR